LGAKKVMDLVDLDRARSEPPVSIRLSKQELLQLKEVPLDLGDIPCHTQAVEAVIPLVTRASLKVSDRILREGFVRNVRNARDLNPNISHKAYFK